MWGVMNIVLFNTILGLLILSHVRAMTCDPGMVSTLPNNQADYNLIQSDKFQQQVCVMAQEAIYNIVDAQSR